MVANKIDVYSKSSHEGSVALHWTSDGHGTYEIDEAENQDMEPGTKVVIQLKENCAGDLTQYVKHQFSHPHTNLQHSILLILFHA